MRNYLATILLLVFGKTVFGFQTLKYSTNEKAQKVFTYDDGREFPTDTFFVKNGKSPSQYNLSSIKMIRKMPNRCHSQEYNLSKIQAVLRADTLILSIKGSEKHGSTILSKFLEIKLLPDGSSKTCLYHSDERYRQLENQDGLIETVPALQSKIDDFKLFTSHNVFNKGSTLKGKLKVKCSYNSRSKYRKVDELLEGDFRVIIE